MCNETRAALELLSLRTKNRCESRAPLVSREVEPLNSTNKTLRFTSSRRGHDVTVTSVPILALGPFLFPGHTEKHSLCWRFHVFVSSALPIGDCCILWYTHQENDYRSVSPVALYLGLCGVNGNPVRGTVYVVVVNSFGRVISVPMQRVFGGMLQRLVHAPGLVVHVPALLHAVTLRGAVGTL